MSNEKEISSHLMGKDTSELMDADIKKAGPVIKTIMDKFHKRLYEARGTRNFEQVWHQFDREVDNRFKEIGIRAEALVDLHTGLFTIDILGRIDDHEEKYGFDHEKKSWEVNEANTKNEDYHGQRE